LKTWTIKADNEDGDHTKEQKMSDETKREWLLIEAAAYCAEKGLPNPPTVDALYNELAGLHGEQCPNRALAMEVLPAFMIAVLSAFVRRAQDT
jgi:hypothetical protein